MTIININIDIYINIIRIIDYHSFFSSFSSYTFPFSFCRLWLVVSSSRQIALLILTLGSVNAVNLTMSNINFIAIAIDIDIDIAVMC